MSGLKIMVCPGCASTQLDNFMGDKGSAVVGFHCTYCKKWWNVSEMNKLQVEFVKLGMNLSRKGKKK